MTLISVQNLAKYYGADLVFSNINLQVSKGEKIALVGINGAGKTTLLKMIAGLIAPDDGTVAIGRGYRMAYLAQEVQFEHDRTLWQEMEAAFAHIKAMQAELHQLEHHISDTSHPDWEEYMQRYGELTARFEHAGGYYMEQRIERTLHGLGFSAAQYQQPLSQLSGGQKTRAAMAAALLSDPDLLLLDEPTNHLDLQALEWLEGFLRGWEGTLVVISHDRYFLDKVTKRTLEMAWGRLEDYPASYSRYIDLKAERMEQRMKEYAAQQEFIARTEAFIRRYKAGQRSKEARGREKQLNRLKEQRLIDRPQQQKRLKLKLGSTARAGEQVLALTGLGVGYRNQYEQGRNSEPHVLLHIEDLEIRRGERVALLGPNGSGKTTLLRTLVGQMMPLWGSFALGHNVAVSYYAQGHENLNMDATVLDEILRVAPRMEEGRARNLLGSFLFSGDDVFKQVKDLSGGERNRVALAQLTLAAGNLLVMDEPTNHLDIDAREALESVLSSNASTLLFVSHDRYFIDAVAEKLWIVQDGTLVEYNGTYSEYQDYRARQLEHESQQADSSSRARENKQRQSDGQRDASEKERKKRIARLEADVERLEQELAQVKAALEQASNAQDVQQVTALGMQYAELEQQLHTRYEEWAELAD